MPSPLPPGLQSKLTGTLIVEVSAQDNINTSVSRQVTLDLHFSWDHTAVMIGLGWPSIVLDNSAPLSPATTTLNVSLLEARLGSFDLSTGHMELPVVLHLDYTPDFFLGKRDQDVNITLSTQGRGPRLWEVPPFIGFEANIEYETNTFFSSSSVHTLSVHLSGEISLLPPAPLPHQPPHLAVCSSNPSQDRLDLFIRGTDNALWYRGFDGHTWSEWQSLGGILTSDPAVVALGPLLIYIFARGPGNILLYKSVSLSGGISGQSGWASLGQGVGQVLTSGPAACSTGPDQLEVFVRKTNNQIMYQRFDGRAWSGWNSSLEGMCNSDPAATAMGGAAWVFVRGTDNALYFMWLRGRDDRSGWQRLDGGLNSAPAMCAPTPATDRMDVFMRGTDNSTFHRI